MLESFSSVQRDSSPKNDISIIIYLLLLLKCTIRNLFEEMLGRILYKREPLITCDKMFIKKTSLNHVLKDLTKHAQPWSRKKSKPGLYIC